MRLTHLFLTPATVAALLATGCNRQSDEARTYTVPKEQAAATQPMPVMPAADIPVGSGGVTWKTPPTWQELAPTSIRIGNFVVPGAGEAKAEVAIFSFLGTVGTELDNVNRWRNELKLEAITEDKIESKPVTIDSIEGKLYEIAGTGESTVVATVSHGDASWYFKMRGDKGVVAAAEPVFREFLTSIHFSNAASPTPAAAVLAGAGGSPHGDLSGGALPTAAPSSGDEPKFEPPSNWTETQPGSMVFKSYTAAGAGKSAKVSVSFLGGTGGGLPANINRWRRQIALPPIEEDKVDSVTQALDTPNGKATVVDFTGTDAKTGEPERLIAIIVPHGDNTWFYKLMGDGAAVEAEKESFVKFVQAVHYP